MQMYKIYEQSITKELEHFPKELCFMLTEEDICSAPEKLPQIVAWTKEFPKIGKLIFYISTSHPDAIKKRIPLDTLGKLAQVRLSSPLEEINTGAGEQEVLIVLGKCGTEEITDAIVRIAKEGVRPEDIDESVIESHLAYKVNPDFVIKTGKSHLTDFLIWQSVYSELFFTDINWDRFRHVDYLRALRDFQSRIRRYGK